MAMVGLAASFLPTLKKLYDVENDRDCRSVRERITGLDIVIEQVIPAALNSCVVEALEASINVPTLIADVDGKEVTLLGADDILAFLRKSSLPKKKQQRKNQRK